MIIYQASRQEVGCVSSIICPLPFLRAQTEGREDLKRFPIKR